MHPVLPSVSVQCPTLNPQPRVATMQECSGGGVWWRVTAAANGTPNMTPMRCPACGEDSVLDDVRFCPHCGSDIEVAEADATREISLTPRSPETTDPVEPSADPSSGVAEAEPAPGAGTSELPAGSPAALKAEVEDVARDLSISLRRAAVAGGWKDLSAAAAFAFLVSCACGAVLVLAAKLHLPSLGEGASAVSILSGIVMAGLGVLGAQIHIGDMTLSALPLGALALVVWAIVWGVGRYIREVDVSGPRESALEGAKVAVPLALICWLAALIFRVRADPDPAFVGAFSAAFAGALWGFVAGALGGLLAHVRPATRLREGLREMERASRPVYEGISAAGAMLVVMGVAVGGAALLWVIVGLIGAEDMVGKEVAAAGIYLIAFLPNIVASVATLALGAAVEVGAQVSAGGELVGRIQEVSLFDWKGDGETPWPLFLLLVIPLLSTVVAGFTARRRTSDHRRMWLILGVAAAIFALVLAELAALADARLGAGLVHERGIGVVAPRALMVVLLGSLWGLGGGLIGWKIAEAQPERPGE